uniref:Uncharacterized protein n=1 Tax=Anguilla anguilla TaxID=7936 RepID=A0A0E9TU36_ANGAN
MMSLPVQRSVLLLKNKVNLSLFHIPLVPATQ